MDHVAIWAVVESKPGKEDEVEAFLKSAQSLAEREPETTSWYAVRIGPSKFGIFDTFPDERCGKNWSVEVWNFRYVSGRKRAGGAPDG